MRQSVLKYHIYLGVPLPAATLVKLLGDSDLGVLLTALDRITSNAGRPEVVDRIEELSRHPDRGIRLKIVSVARDANRFHVRYRSVLRAMMNDQDPQVLSMAAVEIGPLWREDSFRHRTTDQAIPPRCRRHVHASDHNLVCNFSNGKRWHWRL